MDTALTQKFPSILDRNLAILQQTTLNFASLKINYGCNHANQGLLYQQDVQTRFPFILDRNLAKANCTGNRVCTPCDIVVLGLQP